MTTKKICFISHNATRTGAPLVLLHFVKWVKQFHPEIEFEVWLMSDGELKTEFEKLSSVKVIPNKYESSILKRTLSKVFGYSSQRKFLVEVKKLDLILDNTLNKEINKELINTAFINATTKQTKKIK